MSEGGFPFTPDGGLLSVLGDLLFALTVLFLIYPCIQRTILLCEQQFVHQLIYVIEVLLGVAGLCFMLMLLIAQQMRVTYCSFIRPYVKEKSDDSSYAPGTAGVWLKVLVCFLLVINYVLASGLQRVVAFLFAWFSNPDPNPNAPHPASQR